MAARAAQKAQPIESFSGVKTIPAGTARGGCQAINQSPPLERTGNSSPSDALRADPIFCLSRVSPGMGVFFPDHDSIVTNELPRDRELRRAGPRQPRQKPAINR